MSDNQILGGDERLAKSKATEVRGDRVKADAERVEKDGTSFSLAERRQMLRAEWQSDVLPTPPKVDGWHFCWLSTTNSTDPIYKRVQRGYEPVRAEEIPGFAQYKINQGEFEGCVACNEMLLFKIPEEIYQDLMAYFHHELPMEEEEMLRNNLSAQKEHDSNGRPLGQVEGDGYQKLVKKVRNPHF